MKVLRVVGPSDAGKTTLVEGVVDRLSERGRVGTIKHIDCEPDIDTEGKDTARHRAAGAARTEGITTSGTWFATGDDRTLADALDDLARTCDYAVVEGYGDADLPTVALGGADVTDPLVAVPTADAVDVDAVIDRLEATDPYESRRIDQSSDS